MMSRSDCYIMLGFFLLWYNVDVNINNFGPNRNLIIESPVRGNFIILFDNFDTDNTILGAKLIFRH